MQIRRGEILQMQLALTTDQMNRNTEMNTVLSKQIAEMKDDSMWSKIGFFVLGSVITGAIAYGVVRVAK